MTLLWTTPRTWVTNEPITKEKLNAISNNLSYLMKPSVEYSTIRGTASDVSVTALIAAPGDIDNASYQLSVELSGARDVTCRFRGTGGHATLAATWGFDVFIDNTTYLSSLTTTPLANGLWRTTQYVAAHNINVDWTVRIPYDVLTAGVHTFQPRAFVSAGTLTWRMSAGWFSQFVVGEI